MYELFASGTIRRLSDNASIPPDPLNRDYRKYQKWLADGNTPKPEFTPAEIINNAETEKEAVARAAFARRDFEERWNDSPEKANL